MERRSFIKHSAAASAAIVSGGLLKAAGHAGKSRQETEQVFRLKYAPHFGMFRHHAGEDLLDQIQFMADAGFRAMEDNGMKGREVTMQEKIAAKMANLGMEMGVFVAHTIHWTEPDLVSGDPGKLDRFLQEIRESVEVAKRVNARWMTVVPGHVDLRLDMGYQTRNVIFALKRASEILEPHGLVMVLEPLNFRDHPGLFLKKIPQAFQICQAVGSPSCKILDDLYHQQVQEGNLIPNMDLAWDEIAYFQTGDNPGRNEPTTGEINYQNVFAHIHGKGYTGIVGMEHGNSIRGKAGEQAVIDAYLNVDHFRQAPDPA
ncbi:MAG TPA: twin-arginine translocation signal domain-containing protein [Bacteroides sp.]|nr:twin-arginine translocation signal domain-containing protein [Bacteroides sp.]